METDIWSTYGISKWRLQNSNATFEPILTEKLLFPDFMNCTSLIDNNMPRTIWRLILYIDTWSKIRISK